MHEQLLAEVDEDDEEEFTESEEEVKIWKCDLCNKEFKSAGAYDSHMKSKKHRQAVKKHEAKLRAMEKEVVAEMMEDLTLED